jgi:hypothetical protein
VGGFDKAGDGVAKGAVGLTTLLSASRIEKSGPVFPRHQSRYSRIVCFPPRLTRYLICDGAAEEATGAGVGGTTTSGSSGAGSRISNMGSPSSLSTYTFASVRGIHCVSCMRLTSPLSFRPHPSSNPSPPLVLSSSNLASISECIATISCSISGACEWGQ